MSIKKIAYPAAVILLIVAFNLTMFMDIQNKLGVSVSIGILVLLLALVIFNNRTFKFKGDKNQFFALGLLGVALTIINVEVAFIYAIAGLLLLVATQLKIMLNGKPIWLLTGGNLLHKLNAQESKVASKGLTMMLSVALTFFIKAVWLSYVI